jgi:YfiH family protein
VIGFRLDRDGAHFAFTDRWGGVSTAPWGQLNLGGAVGDDPAAVRANRKLAAGALGLDAADVVWMKQVHGRAVAVVTGRQAEGEAPEADAVVTARPGLALAVLTADCVPLLLADPVAGVAAAVHAGRPGMAAGVVPAAVAAMAELGAVPSRTVAVSGPAVCGRCYEVPEEMRAQVSAVAPAATATTRTGRPALDLPAAVLGALRAGGVHDITHDATCTAENDAFYSHRRDGLTGRFAAVVVRDR